MFVVDFDSFLWQIGSEKFSSTYDNSSYKLHNRPWSYSQFNCAIYLNSPGGSVYFLICWQVLGYMIITKSHLTFDLISPVFQDFSSSIAVPCHFCSAVKSGKQSSGWTYNLQNNNLLKKLRLDIISNLTIFFINPLTLHITLNPIRAERTPVIFSSPS